MDFVDFLDSDDDKMENNEAEAHDNNNDDDDDDEASLSLSLPKNPPRGQLQQIPAGWLRKSVPAPGSGRNKIFYFNPVGKRFSSQTEINQYFARLGQSVKPGLFDFDRTEASDPEVDKCSSTTVTTSLQPLPTLLA
jgi:hypothetical protein